jgi:hypothetical protein
VLKIRIVKESYASKASFLDSDNLPTYEKGKNIKSQAEEIKEGYIKLVK